MLHNADRTARRAQHRTKNRPRQYISGTVKKTYVQVLLLEVVQLALLWWLQQAFL
jgi:hypothetical protein